MERVTRIGQKHAGKVYTPEGLTHLIRKQFKDSKLRFYTLRDNKVEHDNFLIKAEYHSWEDEFGDPCIFVGLIYPTNQCELHIDKQDWKNLGFMIADTITHEYIHQHHFRQRDFKHGREYSSVDTKDSYQNYLGSQDEILAYAFNIASEIVVYNQLLERTRIYKLYRRHFRQDQKILLQLQKQTRKYLKQLE